MAWIYGLDSLRLFAIILIMVYHFCAGVFLPGGFVAVEIFFALSGFLITRKLLAEHKKEGKISYFSFLKNRIVHLWLPLALTVLAFCALVIAIDGVFSSELATQSLNALSFTENFYTLLSGSSYENSFAPNIWNHSWFLALEFQVLLIFPLVVKCCLEQKSQKKLSASEERRRGVKLLLLVSLLAGFGSVLLMLLYALVFHQADRAYLMPDSNMMAICFGAALACLDELYPRPPRTRKIWPFFGLTLSALTLILLSLNLRFSNTLTFAFALPFVAFISPIVIYCIILLQPNRGMSPLKKRILRPFEYLGSLSYWLYLVHYPLYIVLNERQFATPGLRFVILFVASFVLAALCDFLWRKLLYLAKCIRPRLDNPLFSKLVLIFSIFVALVISSCVFLANRELIFAHSGDAQGEVTPTKLQGTYLESVHGAAEDARYMLELPADARAKALPISTTDRFSKLDEAMAGLRGAELLFIGDSVMLGAEVEIKEMLPRAQIDAKVSRGIEMAPKLIADYKARGELPKYIVIGLLTNERWPSDQFYEDLMAEIGEGHEVLFLTAYAGPLQPRESQNAQLVDFVRRTEHAHLADWHRIASEDWSLLYGDRIHLNERGRVAYVRLILSELELIYE